jgi:hypothetical protein
MARQGARAAAVVYAADLDRMAGFYGALVGSDWECVAGDGHVSLGTAAFELVVVRVPPHVAATIALTDPPERREETPVKVCLPVDDLALARRTAAELGGVLDPDDRTWVYEDPLTGPVRVCDGHDPEGNVFQLREQP